MITIEALQEGIPTATIEQFVAADKFLPRPFMVIVRGDNEGMELIRLGMDDEGEIDLMKSAIGKGKQEFMMKAGSPDKPVGTGVVPGFDIGRGHDEIRFRFNPVEKIAETQVHKIIVDAFGQQMQRMAVAQFDSEKIDGFLSGILQKFLPGLRPRFIGFFDLSLPQLALIQYFGIPETHGQSLNFSVCSG